MVLCGEQRYDGLAVHQAEERDLGAVEERLEQDRMAVLDDLRGVVAGSVAVGGHHDPLAGRETVVLDDPGGPEPVEGLVDLCRCVDDLAAGGAHSGSGHHILGERLGPFDARGVGGRTEAGNARRADGVGNTEHERDLGADDDEIGLLRGCQCHHLVGGGRVHRELLGDRGDPGVAGGDHHRGHRGVTAQGQDESMFTGTGADNEYAHARQTTGPVSTPDRRGSGSGRRPQRWEGRRCAPNRGLGRRPGRGCGAGARDGG